MTLRPLPRSLDPLAGESLAGYVLRLAHRLDRAPGRIAVLTGLGRGPIQAGRSMAVPVGRLLHLDAATVAAFAHATRLSAQEVAGLCLDSMRDRYPPLDLDYQAAGSRQTNGITGLASWVFTQSTRYCPECLAGDGSPIQQAHGGAWRKLWHLPPVFACTLHRRLLLHQCPQCQQPVHSLRGTGLFPRLRDATPHPAQCLTTIQPAHWSARTACGARLDTSTPSAAATDQPDLALVRLLGVQHKLTGLLQPDGDGPTLTVSAGQSATAAQYFLDLRLLVGLIRASWPEARHQAQPWMDMDAVDDHLHQQRQQASGKRHVGSNDDRPPLEAGACGSLLALADQVLVVDDPLAVRQRLAPLLACISTLPTTHRPWMGHFLSAETHCSNGLRTAIAAQVRALRPTGRHGRPPGSPGRRKPLRDCRFDHQHIPQYLPSGWYERHFHHLDLTGIHPRFLRRVVPLKLVQLAEGGSLDTAARLVGLPAGRVLSAGLRVLHWAHDADRPSDNLAALDAALEALAHELDTTAWLTNYDTRRRALATWTIPPHDWREMTAQLSQRQSALARVQTDWGDRKRRAASVLVWTRITQGEHLFAPIVLADRQAAGRYRTEFALDVHQAWYRSRTDRGGRHYWLDLKKELDAYADQLATKIDLRQPP